MIQMIFALPKFFICVYIYEVFPSQKSQSIPENEENANIQKDEKNP